MAEENSDDFEGNFADLCEFVAMHNERDQPAKALALAIAFLVFRDSADFTARSAACESTSIVNAVAKAQAQERASLVDRALLGPEITDVFSACPLALLAWLDVRLFVGAPNGGRFPGWVTSNAIISIGISKEERDALGLEARLSTIYLFPRFLEKIQAPVERQSHHPGRFLKHWEAVPASPDARQPSRRVSMVQATPAIERSFDRAKGRGQLSIYLGEFLDVPAFDSIWTKDGDINIWRARGLLNEDSLLIAARRHVSRAIGMGADVVVLPELTVTDRILGAIKTDLANAAARDPAIMPVMVVAGSFHQLTEEGTLNRSLVLDGLGRQIVLADDTLLCHDKLTSVQLAKVKVIEGNKVGKTLKLMATSVGAHSIVICLDLAQSATLDAVPLELLPVRWVWVPSMSEKVTAHRERSRQLCLQRALTVACANQAKADFGGAGLTGETGDSFLWATNASSSESVTPEVADTGEQCYFQLYRIPFG